MPLPGYLAWPLGSDLGWDHTLRTPVLVLVVLNCPRVVAQPRGFWGMGWHNVCFSPQVVYIPDF